MVGWNLLPFPVMLALNQVTRIEKRSTADQMGTSGSGGAVVVQIRLRKASLEE